VQKSSHNYIKAVLLFLLLSIITIGTLSSQPNLGDFQTLNMNDGLSSTELRKLFLDRSGHLWISTNFGLNFYDGQQFIKIKQGQGIHSILGLNINCITDLNANTILIGTDQGLSTVNINSFLTTNTIYNRNPEISKNENFIVQILKTKHSQFWILSLSDIKLIDQNLKVLQQYKFKDHELENIGRNNPPRMALLSNNKLWVIPCQLINSLVDNKLFEIDPTINSIKEIHPPFIKYWKGFLSIISLDSNRVLFLEQDKELVYTGIYNLKNNSFYKFSAFEGTAKNFFPQIFNYDERYLIASYFQNDNYYILDTKEERWVKNKFSKKPIVSIISDHVLTKDGVHFWASKQGLLRTDDEKFEYNPFIEYVKKYPEFPWDSKIASLKTQDGKYHIFSYSYDYLCIDPIRDTSFYKKLPMEISTHGMLGSVFSFSKDTFLFSIGLGVRLFDVKTQKMIAFEVKNKPSCMDKDYLYVAQDSSHNFWFCFDRQKGIYKYELKTRKLIPYLNAITLKSAITAACVDKEGNSWFGSRYRNGLIKYEIATDQFRQYFPDFTEKSFMDNLDDLRCDKNGILWLFTTGYGIYGLDTRLNRKFHFNDTDGLFSNYITSVKLDKLNRFWVQTTIKNKFQIINPFDLKIYNYSLLNIEDNNWEMTFLDENHKYAKFISSESEKIIDIENIGKSHKFYGIEVYKLTSFNREFNFEKNKTIQLNYKNNLNIYFSSINYLDGAENQYSYKIEGLPTDWIELKGENIIRLYGIPPGKYNVVMKLCFNGDICYTQNVLKLHVTGPFWQSTYFYLLLCLIIAGILSLFYRIRLKNILKIQDIRQRISSDLHDEIGSGLSSIQIMSKLISSDQVPQDKKNEIITNINDVIKESNQNLTDIIWNVNPVNNDFDKILFRIRKLNEELLEAQSINVEFENELDDTKVHISFETGREYYLIFKEALNNIAKHAGCTEVSIRIYIKERQLITEIKDNGKGFDKDLVHKGNGLINIETRMNRVCKKYSIDSIPGKGNSIFFAINI